MSLDRQSHSDPPTRPNMKDAATIKYHQHLVDQDAPWMTCYSAVQNGSKEGGAAVAGPSRTASFKHEKKVMSAMSQITSAKKAQKSTRESMSKTAGISKVEKQSTKPVRMSTFFTDLLKIMN